MIDYRDAWDLQRETHSARRQSKSTNDVLYLLEHPHTYTLGKVADSKHLLYSKEELENKGIKVYEIDRGGDITYHGPGQLVGYPIIHLSEWKEDTHLYLRTLEEVIIKTCGDYGLETGRVDGLTGVWIEDRKIAAIGIKISKWVTMHGFAFNVNTDLNLFNGIIPCGINDKEVTSLQKELGKDVNMTEVKKRLLDNFKNSFEYNDINHWHI